MAVSTKYVALLHLVQYLFYTSSPAYKVRHIKAFIRPVTVMEMETGRMALTTIYTTESTLISTEPVPYLLMALLGNCYSLLSMSLIPAFVVLSIVSFACFIVISDRHVVLQAFTCKTV